MYPRLADPRRLNRLSVLAAIFALLPTAGCGSPEFAAAAPALAESTAESAAQLPADAPDQPPPVTSIDDGAGANSPEPDGERLRVIPPNGWTLVSSSNQGEFRQARYLRDPDAEVIESLTLEAFSAEGQADPLTFLDGLAANESDRCTDFTRQPTFAGEERGAQVTVELHQCPRRPVTDKATVSLIKVIQGKELYVVLTLAKEARAKSGTDGWQTDFVDESDVARWALYLKSAYLEQPAP